MTPIATDPVNTCRSLVGRTALVTGSFGGLGGPSHGALLSVAPT